MVREANAKEGFSTKEPEHVPGRNQYQCELHPKNMTGTSSTAPYKQALREQGSLSSGWTQGIKTEILQSNLDLHQFFKSDPIKKLEPEGRYKSLREHFSKHWGPYSSLDVTKIKQELTAMQGDDPGWGTQGTPVGTMFLIKRC